MSEKDGSSSPVVAEQRNPQLEALKMEIQQSFNAQQFEVATKKSEEALVLIESLPPGDRIAETIQIHVNVSTACLHMNKVSEAIAHARIAVETAEKGLELAKDNPQAHEILAITLNALMQALLVKGELAEAQACVERSIVICESIYPKNDPRLHKPFRSLAIVFEKKGDLVEAEKLLKKAYLLLHISVGPQVPEAQMLTEDLVNFYMRKGDPDAAEQQAQKNYKGICERSELNDRDQLILADSASRYAALLLRRNQYAEAEPIVEKALTLREQSRVMNRNPIGIAFGIAQLCAVREKLDKLDNSCVQMMMRAIDIFSKVRGPQSSEVANSVAQLQTIRSLLQNKEQQKAEKGAKSKNDSDEEDDGLKYTVKDSKSKSQSVSSPKTSSASASSAEKLISEAKQNAKTNEISEEDKRKMAMIKPDDGNTRMMLANMYFQQSKYNCAEILLAQAYDIFNKQVGPEHQATKAALQNLTVTRNNRLNQLWMEVVSEESLALKLQSLSLSDAASAGDDENDGQSKDAHDFGRVLRGSGKPDTSHLSADEKMFLETLESDSGSSSGCTVC